MIYDGKKNKKFNEEKKKNACGIELEDMFKVRRK